MWIRSHQSYANHPAVLFLQRHLNISKAQVLGHLHLLWYWAVDYSLDGSLKNVKKETIAEAAGYFGSPSNWVKALHECGIIDRNDYLAQWDEVIGGLMSFRENGKERQKRFRQNRKASPLHNAEVTVTSPLRNALPTADVTVTSPLRNADKTAPPARASERVRVESKSKSKRGSSPSPHPEASPPESEREASPDPHIPSLEECLLWAGVAGVDPDWVRRKFDYTTGMNGWVRNQKLIGWQRLWKTWFDEDRRQGKWPLPEARNKNTQATVRVQRALWQIDQEIKILETAIDEHPIHNRCMGQVFTDDEKKEHAAMLEKLAALQKEKKAGMGGTANAA